MIAYVLEGATPQSAPTDPRMARLLGVGPWQYQMHQLGCMATWLAEGPVSRDKFGAERKTSDGLIYLSPLTIPQPRQLFRSTMANRLDLSDVVVNQETGQTIRILPATLTPRQILDDNSSGEMATAYGRAVRALYGKMNASPPETLMSVFADEMIECCRLAIMYSYRATRELVTDLGWLNDGSLIPLWGATIEAPKDVPANGGAK